MGLLGKSTHSQTSLTDVLTKFSGDLVAVNPFQLGWQPRWDQKRFLDSMDDEIQAVQELDTIKSSIYDGLSSKN